jgi:hypothetical protein
VFENRVLRGIFGPKNEDGEDCIVRVFITYTSRSIIRVIKSRKMRWVGYVARKGETRNEYKILVRKTEGKRPLGRPRRRWEDNIRMDLRRTGWQVVD